MMVWSCWVLLETPKMDFYVAINKALALPRHKEQEDYYRGIAINKSCGGFSNFTISFSKNIIGVTNEGDSEQGFQKWVGDEDNIVEAQCRSCHKQVGWHEEMKCTCEDNAKR